MWVGAGRIVLEFFNNTELKLKRKPLETLCKDLKRQFNISILEVADHDEPERAVLGFAVVMAENWSEQTARSFMEKICKTIDETSPARVQVEDWELYTHGEA